LEFEEAEYVTMLIDTHTHLYDEKFNHDRDAMIARARAVGVERFYIPNCAMETVEGMLAVEAQYPGVCFATMGLHPCYVKDDYQQELAAMEAWLERRDFVAIGEIGLDYYWDKTYKEQQHDAFRTQMRWAVERNRPIIIHTREATEDTLRLVKEFVPQGIRGVFHCFSGSYETAQQIIQMGFYLGIGGVVTYPKAGLAEVVARIDAAHLVLETDAPYLSPAPHRGKRNESAYVSIVAEKVAALKEVSVTDLIAVAGRNALKLFGE